MTASSRCSRLAWFVAKASFALLVCHAVLPAMPSALAADQPQPFIARYEDYRRRALDDRDFAADVALKELISGKKDYQAFLGLLGSPQWTGGTGRHRIVQWVHGEQEGAKDFFCDGTSKTSYLSHYDVLEVRFSGAAYSACRVLEQSWIDVAVVPWQHDATPLIEKTRDCLEFLRFARRRS